MQKKDNTLHWLTFLSLVGLPLLPCWATPSSANLPTPLSSGFIPLLWTSSGPTSDWTTVWGPEGKNHDPWSFLFAAYTRQIIVTKEVFVEFNTFLIPSFWLLCLQEANRKMEAKVKLKKNNLIFKLLEGRRSSRTFLGNLKLLIRKVGEMKAKYQYTLRKIHRPTTVYAGAFEKMEHGLEFMSASIWFTPSLEGQRNWGQWGDWCAPGDSATGLTQFSVCFSTG